VAALLEGAHAECPSEPVVHAALELCSDVEGLRNFQSVGSAAGGDLVRMLAEWVGRIPAWGGGDDAVFLAFNLGHHLRRGLRFGSLVVDLP
jgi:hypothetical protein